MIGSMFMNPYSYSLGARCGAEIIGTMIALFLGDAAVANELLAKTKGNGYGWGFLSMGFGLAFGFATMMFDHVSAYLNPAACLFQWVVGNINGTEFLALAFSELAGAFLGAILLWLCYLPHFNVVPEPPSVTEQDPFFADPLLGAGANRTFSPTDLAVGGYNNDPLDRHMRMNPGQAIQGTMRDIGAVLGIVHDDIKQRKEELLKSLGRASVVNKDDIRRKIEVLDERSRTLTEHEEALLVADQNIKLGIFCTRPAIYAPHWNFLCEFMATVTLLVMANMIAARGSLLYEPARGLFGALFGFILGFFIFLIVLVIGGPTGVAINPARDLGPRIAHWMLPIPGKGPSEFLTYGWIPVIAPLCGGAAAGGLFILIQKFTGETNVPPGSVVCPNV
ncbi:putative glycerol uptake facilitator protein [Auxenochlorella protothecoides]|uniref:Putative glycerol uptake facilitator protein n=1 Tax=Auxenochlorella protothecoides TaxID=3075 RepID=A0A087SQB9_AUXPR|nr:putative glycerol uptake facilitator protein [Auxenochlorella protothecoides]KFM27923.1 putative glycerol uptake facilitator protein [Auxenochlorella protothecoides]